MRLFTLVSLGLLATLTACDDGGKSADTATGITDSDINIDDADGDGFSSDTDCDDQDASINPDADEVCDGLDNNCNSLVDDADSVLTGGRTFYADADGDAAGDPTKTKTACAESAGWVAAPTDCNDTDATISPTASEVCDNKDNNCDGYVDEFLLQTYFGDADHDGYGDGQVLACNQPPDTSTVDGDCDDENAAANPGATEICDEVDNNCDGAKDEGVTSTFYADSDGDGYGNANQSTVACAPSTGWVSDTTDCDDIVASVNPSATEICDGIDNNCDLLVDDGAAAPYTVYFDFDMDGYGDPAVVSSSCALLPGLSLNDQDCDDLDTNVNPSVPEICDGIDNNCDTLVDDGDAAPLTVYTDADQDSYGDPATARSACSVTVGYSSDNTDCDDSDVNTYPGAPEICDSADNNCDGSYGNESGLVGPAYTEGSTDFDLASVTASAWVKMGPTGGAIFHKQSITNGGHTAWSLAAVPGSMTVRLETSYYGFTDLAYTNPDIVEGVWFQAAVSYDATSGRAVLYYNGIPVATGEAPAGGLYYSDCPGAPMVVGGYAYGGFCDVIANEAVSASDSIIDDAYVYSSALSDWEVAELASGNAPSGALAHWNFDEASGSTATDDSSSHPLTLDGASWGGSYGCESCSDSSAAISGLGAAYMDDGSAFTFDSVTVAEWAIVDSQTDGNMLFAKQSITSDGHYAWFMAESGGELDIRLETTPYNFIDIATVGAGITAGTWFHVALSYDEITGDAVVYLNGEEIAAQTGESGGLYYSDCPAAPMFFGAYAYGGFCDTSLSMETLDGPGNLDGRLDDIYIYDSVLSASEIVDVAAGNAPAGAAAHWAFSEGSGSSASDSVNGATLTVPAWGAGSDCTP